MLIGELSKKTGFSRDTIRYYEKLGLIPAADRRDHYTNYKNYTEAVLRRLQAIRKIKDYGFTLQETQNMLVLFEEGVLEHERGNRYIKRKIALIDNKIKELDNIKSRLEEIVNADTAAGTCAISKILNEMILEN
jgi:DNA-binding transcriptional MerR regulator